MTAWPKVVVAGGSVGGLTAALVLRDLGCEVDVFERSGAALQARGAGIAVLDATVRYFLEHDLVDVDVVTTATHWIRYLNRDGSTRYEEEHRYRFSSWNTIYRNLHDHFPQERYHLATEVVGFEHGEGGVRVATDDGRETVCDLFVAADGINSPTRKHVLPDVAPRYAGYVAWRGTVPEDELSAETFEVLRDAITYQLFERSHILVYPIPGMDGALEPGQRLANFVWYRNVAEGDELASLLTDRRGRRHETSLPPGAVADPYVEEIRAFADAEMAPAIREVIHRTREPFVQVIFDIEVPQMAFGRVCLLGDAAFAVRPHAAAGTAKAAADAWALAEALAAAEGDVDTALRTWEPRQLALGRDLLRRTQEIGNRSQVTGTWTPGDPTLIFGLHGPGR